MTSPSRRRKLTTAGVVTVSLAELTVTFVPAGAVPAPPDPLAPATGIILTVLVAGLFTVAAWLYLTTRRHNLREEATSTS